MTIDLSALPHPDTLPIPDDVQPNRYWSPLLVEISDHIGPRLALELVARFGGQFIRVPKNADRSPFAAAIGTDAAAILSHVFGGERIELPVASAALAHARRQGVIYNVRAGELPLSQAARILRTSRRYVMRLVNEKAEGTAPVQVRRHHDHQLDMFD